MTSTRGTSEVEAPVHFVKPGPKVLDLGAIKESVERRYTGGTDEKLDSAWIARYVWLFLFGHAHFARVGAYWAWEHLSAV
jgi:hypothetical protein